MQILSLVLYLVGLARYVPFWQEQIDSIFVIYSVTTHIPSDFDPLQTHTPEYIMVYPCR